MSRAQNPDGGWSYFPGKQSWLEPTTYAMLALHGTPGSGAALDRGWSFVRSLQTSDGGFRPNGRVREATWVTAQAVTLALVRGVQDAKVRASVNWLLRVVGSEHTLLRRIATRFHWIDSTLDVSHPGWPWREGNASWIEPTAHTLVALKKAAANYGSAELEQRVREGEALILCRRCQDGGWNNGNPRDRGVDLPSYPESTALALIGLGRRNAGELAGPLALSRRFLRDTKSSLAKAWLTIALRCMGESPDAQPADATLPGDVMLAALQALGHPAGNYRLLTQGGRT